MDSELGHSSTLQCQLFDRLPWLQKLDRYTGSNIIRMHIQIQSKLHFLKEKERERERKGTYKHALF